MTKEEVSKIIKESRIAAGLTQTQVAERLKRPQATVAGWEVGRSQPDANTLFELFRVLGRSVDEAFGFTKHPFEVSSLERAYIEKYRALDAYGQDTVSAVLEWEHKRCTEQAEAYQNQQTEAETVFFVVPWYFLPMSAGAGEEAGDEQPENLRLIKEPPRGTSFVAPVRGDSMEPTFHDGDRLFIRAQDEIEPGQIGVFWMDGKQWVKELGDRELISHNPAYAPRPLTGDIRCQGLVLGVCDSSYFE